MYNSTGTNIQGVQSQNSDLKNHIKRSHSKVTYEAL